MGEMEFAAVFQAVDHFQGAVVADQGGAGKLKCKLELVAVRAGEGAFDFTGKRLAAGFAKRLHEPWQIRVAVSA